VIHGMGFADSHTPCLLRALGNPCHEVRDAGVDRADTGLHILELTGPPRRIAVFPR